MSEQPIDHHPAVGPTPPMRPPLATALAAAPISPVGDSERIEALDVLRGIAVLGILLVNIAFMAFPFGPAESWNWSELSWPDRIARTFVELLAEMKFITLFSLLFGMGLALQHGRAARAGRPFAGLYARRLAILLLLGIAHGLFLWYGDILSTYAVIGFLALAVHRLGTRALLIIATVLALVPMAALGGCLAAWPQQFEGSSLDWQTAADEMRKEKVNTDAHADPAAARADEMTLRFYDFMGREEEIYRDGSFLEITLHRTAMFAMTAIFSNLLIFSGRCLALFLLGICLIRAGMFIDPDWPSARYRRMISWGLLLGLPLQAAAFWTHLTSREGSLIIFLQFTAIYLGSFGIAAAYAGAIGLWCRSPARTELKRRLAAVGRMALTNYLLHSLFAAFIFHAYGLGLFGAISHAQSLILVLAIFMAQLLVSPWWLGRFRFGPIEWLWRCGTYWRREPLRRRPPPAPLLA